MMAELIATGIEVRGERNADAMAEAIRKLADGLTGLTREDVE
jgi:hypothetical protein